MVGACALLSFSERRNRFTLDNAAELGTPTKMPETDFGSAVEPLLFSGVSDRGETGC
jgi:hypothetical protein